MAKDTVLIVDSDAAWASALLAALRHAGFEAWWAPDGVQGLAMAHTLVPDVVVLDLWLPGLDGLELLAALRAAGSAAVAIVTTESGNVPLAVRALKLGAADYLEKPCAFESVLRAICHLKQPKQREAQARRFTAEQVASVAAPAALSALPRAVPAGLLPQGKRRQRTLRRPVVLHGQGLQTGLRTGVVLAPLPPNSGIVFHDLATGERMPALVDFVTSTDFCTSLGKNGVSAWTVEHLLSALCAYGVTNVLVKLSSEVPIMDGSALAFAQALAEAGIEEQPATVEELVVDRCYTVGQSPFRSLVIEPYDGLRVTYRLQYPPPIGVQEVSYEHRDGSSYRREIAPARTFASVQDVERLHALGLVAGGRLNNVILLDGGRVINTTPLRFPDELARHKILDLLGDLCLLGRPVRGHLRASMTGHTENIALVRCLRQALLRA